MSDQSDMLEYVRQSPRSYGQLLKWFGPEAVSRTVEAKISAACRAGQMFYVYDVPRLVQDRVRGMITWVGAEDHNISSLDRVIELLRELTAGPGETRLRNKLKEISSSPQDYGEWPYRIVACPRDSSVLLNDFSHLFAGHGEIHLVPSNSDEWVRWYFDGTIPLNLETISEADIKWLHKKTAQLQEAMRRAKGDGPFASYVLTAKRRMPLRFFHAPASAEILALQAANAARLAEEDAAVNIAAQADDLQSSLARWLQPC